MSPRDDERRPGGGGGHVDAGQADALSVRRERHREALRHAWGHAYLVTARSGRVRLVVLVTRCPERGCSRTHQFTAPADWTSGVRTAAPCGRFVVHALLSSAVAA